MWLLYIKTTVNNTNNKYIFKCSNDVKTKTKWKSSYLAEFESYLNSPVFSFLNFFVIVHLKSKKVIL